MNKLPEAKLQFDKSFDALYASTRQQLRMTPGTVALYGLSETMDDPDLVVNHAAAMAGFKSTFISSTGYVALERSEIEGGETERTLMIHRRGRTGENEGVTYYQSKADSEKSVIHKLRIITPKDEHDFDEFLMNNGAPEKSLGPRQSDIFRLISKAPRTTKIETREINRVNKDLIRTNAVVQNMGRIAIK
jgi:hypothetical protein